MSGILSAICTNYTITSAFPSTVKVLVVGGGGGGGISAGGGGGGGGVLYDSAYAITNNTSYTVTIGSGGAGGTLNNGGAIQTTGLPTNGGDSIFGSLTAIGGGKGGTIVSSPRIGGNGGSGGGGCGLNPGASGGDGGLGTSGQGFDGGDGNESGSNFFNGAGGGGAGETSATVFSNAGTKGGDGVANLISGSSVIYGGGGGGSGNVTAGDGGSGGGGAGSSGNNNATNGTNGLGGGGGGARCDGNINGTTSGNGGSGVVIISYVGSPIATGGTITSSGGNTIHTFTSSGSFVVGTPPVTYATWNPADKSSNLSTSGGDLVVTHDGSVLFGIIRSTIGKSSGKWYWEITDTTDDNAFGTILGVANSSATFSNFLGTDANGWGYGSLLSGGPYKWNNNANTSYGATYSTGDIIGVALDMDSGTVEMFKNGVSQGVMFSGLSGTIFACGSIPQSASVITANFGATPFAYTPPVGFNAGLYA